MRTIAAGLLGIILCIGGAQAYDLASPRSVPDDQRNLALSAEKDCDAGRYDLAAAKFQAIADKYPDCLCAWGNLGVIRSEQGRMSEACRAFQQAVRISPRDPVSQMHLGMCYFDQRRYAAAISPFERAEAINPANSNVHAYLARCYQKVGRMTDAEKERQAENVGQMDTYR
jgi:predicted Zn-dependent protease